MAGKRQHILVLLLILKLASPTFCQALPASSPSTEARVESLLKQLTLEEKVDLLGGVDDFYIREVKHIGLPRLKMADGPLGVRNYGPATAFGGLGLAATWDLELVQKMAAVIGQDARARGVHFMLGPGVNIYRAPLCGRNFEYFGEDPYLSARTAVAYIKGLQSQSVSATVKHFMGNNSEYDRHNANSLIDERTMREIYLPAFEAAVKEAKVGAIMDSYNLTNGQHMTQNGYLNNEVVKKEWGFQGIIMSDWDSVYDGLAAANAGLDLEMPSGKFMNRQTLLPAIQSGQVKEATIDDKVRRILRTAIQFGWLERDQTDSSIPLLNPNGREVALEAARAAVVLLKNEGNVLPLDKTRIKSIALIGPDAYPTPTGGGGSAEVRPFVAVSYLEGLANYLGSGAQVYYQRGLPSLDDMAKATSFTTDADGRQVGLKGEYFNNTNLAGTPVLTRVDQHVNYDPDYEADMAAADKSIRWRGYFTPKAGGDYLVFVQGPGENGGYRLYVDQNLVFDNWKQWRAFLAQTRLRLQPGPHQVELDYSVNRGWGKTRVRLGILSPETIVQPEAKSLASRADAVVLAAGFDTTSEGESADRGFALPPGEDELISQIAGTNKNTIVVNTSGGGVDMSAWVARVPAILQSFYPGQEGGTALAQLLFGDYSPSGRLPITVERRWEDSAVRDSYYPNRGGTRVAYSEGVFVGYRHFDQSGIKPLFPFGYGLSYTSFAYKNLSVSPASVTGGNPVAVSFDVTNTGNRAGAEVAEVYVGDHHAHVPRPVKELKGFSRVYLNPGETKQVMVTLDARAFSYYDDKNHRWTAEPGEFDILVGRSAAQIELTGKLALQNPK
jgi:beta-glucosidase